MITNEVHRNNPSSDANVARVDMKLEAVVVPVSDVDRAKAFYTGLGWRLDADFRFESGFRVVQLTPPGSACSVIFGAGVTSAAPGSAEGLQLVVDDIEAARAELVGHGAEVSEVFQATRAVCSSPTATSGRAAGPRRITPATAPSPRSATRTATAGCSRRSPPGCPGAAIPAETTFGSAADLASALRRAEAAHGEHEKQIGHADPDWPDWYAQYMVAEQAGTELPT